MYHGAVRATENSLASRSPETPERSKLEGRGGAAEDAAEIAPIVTALRFAAQRGRYDGEVSFMESLRYRLRHRREGAHD